jgi:hypothetical protein
MGVKTTAATVPESLAYGTKLGFCLKGKAEEILTKPDIADHLPFLPHRAKWRVWYFLAAPLRV